MLIVALLMSFSPSSAHAEAPAASSSSSPLQSIAPIAAAIDAADARSQQIAAGSHSATVSDAGLRQRLAAIPAVQAQLQDAMAALKPRLQAVDAKLAELGPPPGPGQAPEESEVAQERSDLVRTRAAVDTELKLGGLVQVEVEQLKDYLVTRRRSLFAERLWRHDLSPVNPAFWRSATDALALDQARVARLVDERVRASRPPGQMASSGKAWIAMLLAALVFAGPLRVMLSRFGIALARRKPPTRLRQSLLALWFAVTAGATTWLACMTAELALPTGFLSAPFTELADAATQALMFASLFAGLGRGLFSAALPDWRIAPVTDAVARRLRPYPALIGLSAGASTLLIGAAGALGLSEPSAAAIRSIVVGCEILVIGMALYAASRSAPRPLPSERAASGSTAPKTEARLGWVIAALSAWLAVISAIGAVLVGYVSLAVFLVGEMIWIGSMLAVLSLLVRLVDDLFPALTAPRGRTGAFFRNSMGLPSSSLEQMGVLLAGAARLTLLLLGWIAIVAPFGGGAGDVIERLTSTDLILHFGQVAISPGTIVGGALVFMVAIAATRGVRRWLEFRFLPKTAFDVGAKTAMSAGVGYIGVITAIVVASSYLGLSVDRITLLASALSVGIGFGLQSVIGNFVSGLILLAERPVKVGDWIAIGDLEGDVRRIRVRATEIEMRDRSKLIVPNSDLISKTVRNVTHGSSLGRIKIVLLVDDKTEVTEMHRLLMDRLSQHSAILPDPAPGVFLSDVRDGALEFTAFAYVASPRESYRVRSDLLFAIVPELKREGISLANSAPIVNVGLADRAIEPAPPEKG